MSDQNWPQAGNGNVYAPPEARVDDVVPEGEFQLADRGTRFVAAIVDVLPAFVVGIMAAIAIPAMKDSPTGAIIFGILMVIAAIALIAINCMWIHRRGQTIGKRVMSIKTVRTDGSRCGLRRVFFLRYLPTAILGAVPFVGAFAGLVDCLLIFRANRKCLHDNIADTNVVKV